jgi:hypothetical protein
MVVAVVMLVCRWGMGGETTSETSAKGQVRIGKYDPRAVAVAWAASKPHAKIMAAKMEEMKKAKAEGDQAKVKSLEAWGKRHQAKLHSQGFSGADVSDIMATVKEQLPDVAKRAGVNVVVGKLDFAGQGVEVVDVTDEVVKVFEPSERTLKMIEDLRKKPVVDEEVVTKGEE